MDISAVLQNDSGFSATQLAGQVGVAVLKKAMDAQMQASMNLIAALPPVQNLPSNLGNSINTVA